jgi:hypothetical protein
MNEKGKQVFAKKNGRHMNKSEVTAMEKVTTKKVLDAFINYSNPDSKLLQYMNDMGLVMFTKFALRMQKVLKEGVRDKPLNFLLVMFAQDFVIGDVADITDTSFFTRDWLGSFKNPLDNLTHALFPTMFEVPAMARQIL